MKLTRYEEQKVCKLEDVKPLEVFTLSSFTSFSLRFQCNCGHEHGKRKLGMLCGICDTVVDYVDSKELDYMNTVGTITDESIFDKIYNILKSFEFINNPSYIIKNCALSKSCLKRGVKVVSFNSGDIEVKVIGMIEL